MTVASVRSRVMQGACDAARGSEADAGLVPSKTKLTKGDFFEISTRGEPVFERRFARMRRSVWWSGQGHGEKFSGWFGQRAWFVTLTYRPGDEWSSDHIKEALQRVRMWLKRQCGQTLRYTWVAELQKRGAVHYHLVIYLPKRLSMPKWDKKGWWPHGMTNTQVAKVGVGYLMKYVSKFSPFHKFPKGMRLYGIGGLNTEARAIRTWHNMPEWVKQEHGVGDVKRTVSGFVVRGTGEILESPWVVLRGAGRVLLRLVRELPERWADGPYSTLSYD